MMKQVCIKTRDYNLGATTHYFVYKSSNGLFYGTPEEALRGDALLENEEFGCMCAGGNCQRKDIKMCKLVEKCEK